MKYVYNYNKNGILNLTILFNWENVEITVDDIYYIKMKLCYLLKKSMKLKFHVFNIVISAFVDVGQWVNFIWNVI